MDSPDSKKHPPDSKKRKRSNKAPSPRRDGREAAVQFLFGDDIQADSETTSERLESFWELRLAKSFARDFATTLVTGFQAHRTEIDAAIRETLENFAFERITPVDRSILRIGTFEILFADHIPPQAAINEAIEIAKRFGSDDSPRFVNGILDRILKTRTTD